MAPRAQRRCIFCDGTRITGEHLFSEWMHPLLRDTAPEFQSYITRVPVNHQGDVALGERRRQQKVVSPLSQTLPVVCKNCNSGWMSRLEEKRARGPLTKLINGEPHVLTPQTRRIVAEWAAMKFMALDASKPSDEPGLDPSFIPAERLAFGKDRTLPEGLQLVMLPTKAKIWRHTYLRMSGLMQIVPGEVRAESNNTNCIFLGVGKVLIVGFYRPLNTLELKVRPAVSLLPAVDGNISWPPDPALTDSDIDARVQATQNYFLGLIQDPRRHRIALSIVAPVPDATILFMDGDAPFFGGKEFVDLVCGKCSFVLAEGMSVHTLRDMVAVPAQLLLRCPKCGEHNLVPVQGTKRQRAGKKVRNPGP